MMIAFAVLQLPWVRLTVTMMSRFSSYGTATVFTRMATTVETQLLSTVLLYG